MLLADTSSRAAAHPLQNLSRLKIPIPPEYGKEVILKAIPLKGDLEIESIKIIPPGNAKPYSIYSTTK